MYQPACISRCSISRCSISRNYRRPGPDRAGTPGFLHGRMTLLFQRRRIRIGTGRGRITGVGAVSGDCRVRLTWSVPARLGSRRSEAVGQCDSERPTPHIATPAACQNAAAAHVSCLSAWFEAACRNDASRNPRWGHAVCEGTRSGSVRGTGQGTGEGFLRRQGETDDGQRTRHHRLGGRHGQS